MPCWRCYAGTSSRVVALRFGFLKPFTYFALGLGGVLGRELLIGSVVEPRAADSNGANGKLMFGNPDVSQRLRNEGAIPAAGFVVPGSDHHAAIYNNYPDWYIAMIARADIQILGLFQLRQQLWRKSLCR